MKFFSKSKSEASGSPISMLKADMHSHLIPGIDDGSPDMETSLRLIKGMMELGYTKLITTPHIMWDMYQNNRDDILTKLEELRSAAKNAGFDVEINAAAEYFLDDHVSDLLKSKTPLLPISGNMVLTEFSMAHPPMNLKDILFDMQMQGYQPVIAHPERYSYLDRQKDFYEELRDIGCLFQVNLLSLGNYYGKQVHNLAQYLINKGYYDLVGTDLHHTRHLANLYDHNLSGSLRKLIDSGKIRNAEL